MMQMMWVVFIKIRMQKWGVVLQFSIAIKKKKTLMTMMKIGNIRAPYKWGWKKKTRAQFMRAENRRISEWTVEYRFK